MAGARVAPEPALGRGRLWALRFAYLLLAAGLAATQLPLLYALGPEREIMHGVVICMLSALGLLSAIGLFRPVAMLPLLGFEILWKLLWLGLVAWPAWRANTLSGDIAANLFACALVIPIIACVPWKFVVRKILQGAGS